MSRLTVVEVDAKVMPAVLDDGARISVHDHAAANAGVHAVGFVDVVEVVHIWSTHHVGSFLTSS